MSEFISLSQLLSLTGIHLIVGIILYSCGHILLPESFRVRLALVLAAIFGWSLIALLALYNQQQGFIGWLFNPGGEKNFAALLNTTLLMLIAVSSMSLMRASGQKGDYVLVAYWLLLSALFLFLAIDEYFSIHETIVFWRGGYLILGGTAGLISLVVMLRGDSQLRPIMLMFIIGLGIMGVSGVVLDAFSTQNLLDIGPIKFTFIRCRGEFLGINCREFGNTEEMMELFGAAMMWLSVIALTYREWSKEQLRLQRRFIYSTGIGWLLSLMVWMWVAPEIQARFAHPAQTDYGDISLIAYDLNTEKIQPGDKLKLTIYAQADTNTTAQYSMSVHLYTQATPAIESIVQDDIELGEFVYPSHAWLPRLAVRNRFQLDIPDDLPLNQSYQLVAIVWKESVHNRVPVQETIFPVYSDGTTLLIDGIAAPAEDTVPGTRSTTYQFIEGFALSDFTVPDELVAGTEVNFDFLWEVTENQDIAATHFMHWFNLETEEYIIFDHIPFDGLFPTQDWVAGMRVRDSWTITVPDEPGTYRIQTGMFDTVTGERLAVSDSSGQSLEHNLIPVAEVEVSR